MQSGCKSVCAKCRWVLALLMLKAAWAHGDVQTQPPHPKTTPCLLEKLTSQNSYLQDFGGGAVLRVPRCLVPGLKIKDPNTPIKSGSLSMVFWFPDMTLTSWTPPVSYFLDEAQHKKYIPQRNRFPVRIFTLFNVNSAYQPDPTPHQIEKNMARLGNVQRIQTPYPDLMAEVSKAWVKKHPDAAKFNIDVNARFAEKPHSPYDIYMICDPPTKIIPGDNCKAYVYEKTHEFEYMMEFPHEAVSHTDGLVRAIDKLVGKWWESAHVGGNNPKALRRMGRFPVGRSTAIHQ